MVVLKMSSHLELARGDEHAEHIRAPPHPRQVGASISAGLEVWSRCVPCCLAATAPLLLEGSAVKVGARPRLKCVPMGTPP
jgi:hypothetical protein